MDTCDLGSKWLIAAVLPAIPSVNRFAVRQDSPMAKLQREFNRVGLVHYSGRGHIVAAAPSPQQEKKLKEKGVDVSTQRLFTCSPRRA
jgi:hypothetical protein